MNKNNSKYTEKDKYYDKLCKCLVEIGEEIQKESGTRNANVQTLAMVATIITALINESPFDEDQISLFFDKLKQQILSLRENMKNFDESRE